MLIYIIALRTRQPCLSKIATFQIWQPPSFLIWQPPSSSAQAGANRKQRELYVGNLPVGMVTPAQLRELFRAPLLTMPNMGEADGPLVNNVDLAVDGKFAFVEFRDEVRHLAS